MQAQSEKNPSTDLLKLAGLFWKGKDLSGIAQNSASWGDLIAELGSPDFKFSVANAPPCSPAEIQRSLEVYLQNRLTGAKLEKEVTSIAVHFEEFKALHSLRLLLPKASSLQTLKYAFCAVSHCL